MYISICIIYVRYDVDRYIYEYIDLSIYKCMNVYVDNVKLYADIYMATYIRARNLRLIFLYVSTTRKLKSKIEVDI